MKQHNVCTVHEKSHLMLSFPACLKAMKCGRFGVIHELFQGGVTPVEEGVQVMRY